MTQKPILLALILFGITVVLSGIIFVITLALEGTTSIIGLAAPIAAAFVGQLYSKKFKELIPKQLKLKTTIYFILITLIVSAVYGFAAEVEIGTWLIISVIVNAIYAPVVYLMLSLGSKMQIKRSLKN